MQPASEPDRLRGFRVGVTADRRGGDQAVLLRRLGVEVVRGPVLRTERATLDADLRAATAAIVADPPEFLVANTGFGMRTWWERAAEWGLDGALAAALRTTRIAARGPKAAGAVRSAGLELWWRSPTEQLDSVAERLLAEGVDGATVAIQRHGDDHPVTERLARAGARILEVPVYREEAAADTGPARALLREVVAGGIDALTFTAAPAVRALVELADGMGLADGLLDAGNAQVAVVCIGPVCAQAAVEEGFTAPVVPEHWRLGSMTTLVGRLLADRRVERAAGPVTVVVQGGLLRVGGQETDLPGAAHRALALLAVAAGRPVPAAQLRPEGMAALQGLVEPPGPLAGVPLVEVEPGGARLVAR